MATKSIVPSYLAQLEPYLEARLEVFEAQTGPHPVPTLPSTNDGKVNVARLVRDLGLKATAAQHFFTKPELREAVNVVAAVMGLAPIGSRSHEDAIADAAHARLAKLGQAEKRAAEGLAEALRRIDLLEAENEALRQRIGQFEAQIDAIYRTGDVPFLDPLDGEDW